jgi:hypothetical protein
MSEIHKNQRQDLYIFKYLIHLHDIVPIIFNVLIYNNRIFDYSPLPGTPARPAVRNSRLLGPPRKLLFSMPIFASICVDLLASF